MESVKFVLKNNIRQYGMLIALVVIMAFFQVTTNGILLVPMNVTNLVLQNAYVFILAIGMTLTILAGGNIDLSVGSLVAFIGAISGALIVTGKMNVGLGIVLSLLVGLLVGIWQGAWIAYMRIPAFIVTLAGMLTFRGLTIYMLQGLTLGPYPNSFQAISSGFVPDFLAVPGVALNMTAVIAGIVVCVLFVISSTRRRIVRRKNDYENQSFMFFFFRMVGVSAVIMLIAFWLAAYKGLPIIFIIIAVLVLAYSFYTTRTVPGRHVYAVGGNEKAAKLSGINTNRVLFAGYVNIGVLAAVAGIAFTSRLNAASPVAGQNFELDAIAACFIGGASAYGGVGTIIGSIIGALVMGVLNNGMSIMGAGTDIQQIVKGLVLLAAVAFDVSSKKRA
jgi:putative multiple sugar transport system permease protein